MSVGKKKNLFDLIPAGFFNCLASGSNQRIYADCMEIIYEEYESEISYRIPRNRIRDAIAYYFAESRADLSEEECEDDRTPNGMAGAVIRRFLSKDVAWLEEEIDDVTYEKQIIMTENGIAMAEFLNRLKVPEKEEYSSYIYNIYNTLNNENQWKEDPYAAGIKNIYKNARDLSKSLKKLSTFIRKIIEKMIQEKTLESLTENILEYCEGTFIREYSRLTKQQNIHIYRMSIKSRLSSFLMDDDFFEEIVRACMEEEKLEHEDAYDKVWSMIQATNKFLVEDYDQIMRDIKHKINIYLQIAIGRARFIRNRGQDTKGNVERVIRYMVEEMQEVGMKEELPEEMNRLFQLDRNEFLDEASIRYPRKNKLIEEVVETEIEELTEEAMEEARNAHLKEAYNPYSRELMKEYIEKQLGEGRELSSDDLPLESKRDLLAGLSAVAYARENGFNIELQDGYCESNSMMIRRFKIIREED